MRSILVSGTLFAVFISGAISGCSNSRTQSPDVANAVRQSLDQAGLKDVSVSQDRDKGVVTLTGTTASDADKSQAESIANSVAAPQVVADEIAVRPPGDESTAKKVDSDLDKGIANNFDAILVPRKLDSNVKYSVKNGVITLTGKVHSQARRTEVEKMAAGVPNVLQVVNELEVQDQKATSTN